MKKISREIERLGIFSGETIFGGIMIFGTIIAVIVFCVLKSFLKS